MPNGQQRIASDLRRVLSTQIEGIRSLGDVQLARGRGNVPLMKTLTISLATLFLFATGCAVQSAPPEPVPTVKTDPNIAPQGATYCETSYETGATTCGLQGGGGGGNASCPTGKEIMDCVRHCGVTNRNHPDLIDDCISSCSDCVGGN